jgi:hypothetical protein
MGVIGGEVMGNRGWGIMNIGRRRRNDFQVPGLAVFFHGFTTKDTKSTKGLEENKTLDRTADHPVR